MSQSQITVTDLFPKPGDAVLLTGPYWGAETGSIGIIDGHWYDTASRECLVCFNLYGGAAFFGPSAAWSQDQTPQVSCSGGPLPGLSFDQLKSTGQTHSVTFWRWKDTPRADGGEQYQLDVPLWEWDGIG